MHGCNFTVELHKTELLKKKRNAEGGNRVKWEAANSKENCTVSCSVLKQMNSCETAAETRVKCKTRGCILRASSTAYLWMLHWGPLGDVSPGKHSCSVLYHLFEREFPLWGRICYQTGEEWDLYLALKGIWVFLGLGNVKKREKHQCTE